MATRPAFDEGTAAGDLKRDLLVPVDYSEPSRAALAAAVPLAATLAAKIVVLHAWECPPFAEKARALPASPGAAHRPLGELIAEAAANELERFIASTLQSSPAAVETRLVSGSPARAILEELESGRYGLVVMGTHGHSPAGALLLGSVTERVLRLSATPVLVVPSHRR